MTHRPQLPPAFNIIELSTVGSTNEHIKQLARSGYPAFTLVWAHEQTAGKGRQGNGWTSVPGNLYMSLLLRPNATASQTGQLSFLAAVALAETVKEVVSKPVQISLKWPNDLLLNARKAAGILLEAEEDWVVMGIGVNVAGAPDAAASLAAFGCMEDAGAVLGKLAVRIKSLYDSWTQKGFDPIRAEWLHYAHNIGSTIQVRMPKEYFTGRFAGIDDSGALELEMPGGEKRAICSGEVFIG
ncbi:MAG TPA: biotin--[acetyl-CoA-carboxylase] ligase [Patescibacteria group bacterium]|nr:biotin--[acetyl-CoA-carboxylase] ligase [Patescibacteria group bacterium]